MLYPQASSGFFTSSRMSLLTPSQTKDTMIERYGAAEILPGALGGTLEAAVPSPADIQRVPLDGIFDIFNQRLLAFGLVLGRAPSPPFTSVPQPRDALERQNNRRSQLASAFRTPVLDMDLEHG